MGLIKTNESLLTSITADFLLHLTMNVFADFSLCPIEQDIATMYGFCKYIIRMTYDEEISDAVIDNLTGRNKYVEEYKEKFNNQLAEKCEMFNYFSNKIIQKYGPHCINSILKVFAAVIIKDTALPDDNDICFKEVFVAVNMYHDSLLRKRQIDYEHYTNVFFEELEKTTNKI